MMMVSKAIVNRDHLYEIEYPFQHNCAVVQFTFRQPMYLFIENGVTGTVCIDKVGQTDQSVTLMVSGRK